MTLVPGPWSAVVGTADATSVGKLEQSHQGDRERGGEGGGRGTR